MRRLLQAALGVFLTVGGGERTLNAQLSPGDRVRVHHAAGGSVATTTGTFVELTPSELLLNKGRTIGVPRDSIRALERGVPGDSHIYLGTVIGGVVGIVAGASYGLSYHGPCNNEKCLGPLYVVGGAFVGGLGGMVAGWLVGSRFKRTDWQTVDLPVRVGVLLLPRTRFGAR